MAPKWDPNHIFDAEALRKPLGSLLERSWKLLDPKSSTLERLLGAPREISKQVSKKRGVPIEGWLCNKYLTDLEFWRLRAPWGAESTVKYRAGGLWANAAIRAAP